jgi:nitroreductase
MNSDFSNRLMHLIKDRRSVRIFNSAQICRDDITSIIEAGTWAPTGCNNQELRFLILCEKDELEQFIMFKRFLRGVSAVVLVFCDMSLPRSHRMYKERKHQRQMPYVDTGLALANMVLYAKAKGIDSCIINLSKYHAKRSREQNTINKLMTSIKWRLGLYSRVENNFEFYLRNHLKLPSNLKIMCGVAFGFAAKYPDVKTFKHGGESIMRRPIDYYIIPKQ